MVSTVSTRDLLHEGVPPPVRPPAEVDDFQDQTPFFFISCENYWAWVEEVLGCRTDAALKVKPECVWIIFETLIVRNVSLNIGVPADMSQEQLVERCRCDVDLEGPELDAGYWVHREYPIQESLCEYTKE
jgi:hypothetical protein